MWLALVPIICLSKSMLVCATLPRYPCAMQGFWPDGIYVAPTDEALKSDIVVSKQMGYNMLRKHIKVERDRLVPLCPHCSSEAAICCVCTAWHRHDPTIAVCNQHVCPVDGIKISAQDCTLVSTPQISV